MADEEQTEKKPDGVVSLEDIVSENAQANAPAATETSIEPAQPAAAAAKPADRPRPFVSAPASSSTLKESDITMARVDSLLEREDPVFARTMAELKKEKISELAIEDEGLDAFVDENKVDADSPLPKIDPFGGGIMGLIRKFKHDLKNNVKQIGPKAKEFAQALLAGFKDIFKKPQAPAPGVPETPKSYGAKIREKLTEIGRASRAKKLKVLGALGIVALLGFILKTGSINKFLPNLHVHFLPTVAAHPDASFEYTDEEPMEDFFSPYRHPEHVILLDKIVVNLRPSPSSDGNPMGLFEFYIELTSQDAAIEVSDRQNEVSDMVQRTVEQISYDDIITRMGKEKLKLSIRQNVNTILTKGRVRRVFFKSIVVKP